MYSFYSKFLEEQKRRCLNLKGIISRRYAYKGPDVIQFDLTDQCSSNCVACWIHSPFFQNHKNSGMDEISFSVLKKIIKDIAAWGTKEIIISGGGEPFLYPHIWDALELIEKTGMRFRINTNLMHVKERDIKRIVAFDKLDSLTVSIWASEAELYAKIHGRDESDFYKVKSRIEFLNTSKPNSIFTTLYAVMTKLNHFAMRDMFDFGIATGSDAVEFGLPDIMPGITEFLSLDQECLKYMHKNFTGILKYAKKINTKLKIANKNVFMNRILNQGSHTGEYDSFMASTPCYAGWTFLRIRANGDLNSCLKSHRMPIGNIYRDSIAMAWNNSLQQQFREKSLAAVKDKKYFKFIGNAKQEDIGCKRMCDNILVNTGLYRFMKYIRIR
jgi:MoaA/NifB/PqqE/SkfB family radical SAM enzyme